MFLPDGQALTFGEISCSVSLSRVRSQYMPASAMKSGVASIEP